MLGDGAQNTVVGLQSQVRMLLEQVSYRWHDLKMSKFTSDLTITISYATDHRLFIIHQLFLVGSAAGFGKN